jgi:L-alanine-DL-glutamate epimerase-like enolase superfamily enzyme
MKIAAVTPFTVSHPEPNPMQDELVTEPFSRHDGFIEVPRRPGLGVEVRVETLEKYAF